MWVDYLLLAAVDLVSIVVDDFPFKGVDPAWRDGDLSGWGGDKGLGAFSVVMEGGRSGDVAGEAFPIGLLVDATGVIPARTAFTSASVLLTLIKVRFLPICVHRLSADVRRTL